MIEEVVRRIAPRQSRVLCCCGEERGSTASSVLPRADAPPLKKAGDWQRRAAKAELFG